MKKLKLLFAGIFCSVYVYSQNAEFKVYENGLIYSEAAMGKLTKVVDQLNLKYKTCDFNTVFYAKAQTLGYFVRLKGANVRAAKAAVEAKLPLEEFINRYPEAEVAKDVLILKYKYTNYSGQREVTFSQFSLKDDDGFYLSSKDTALYDQNLTGQWLHTFYERSDFNKEELRLFYFKEPFSSVAIPQKYAQMIGYADCLIDTTVAKLKDNLKDGDITLPKNWTKLSFDDKTMLLDQLRSTRVIGNCSYDQRPRTHAVNIALLSAETYNWRIFLKAHLDIMNDRFDRMSDGSYAKDGRKTYIRELESLHINVADLLVGIALRVENPASNHYFGDVGRLSIALAESRNRAETENIILAAVQDDQLDLYNRLLFYFLFSNYTYSLKDKEEQKEKNVKLLAAVKTLPHFIAQQLGN